MASLKSHKGNVTGAHSFVTDGPSRLRIEPSLLSATMHQSGTTNNSSPFQTSASPVLHQNVNDAQSQFGQGSSRMPDRVSLTPNSKIQRDRTNAQIFKGVNLGQQAVSRLQSFGYESHSRCSQ